MAEIGGQRHWVCYGSQVTGTAGPGSDLDVLLVHDAADRPPARLDATVGEVPVTIYGLCWSDLAAAGRPRAFGGYFALKLFGPFVCWPPGPEPVLLQALAGCLAPLAAAGAPTAVRTRDQVLADAYLAFLSLYPDFDGYAARQLRLPLAATPLWQRQAAVVIDAFLAGGYLRPVAPGRFEYTGDGAPSDPARERAAATARFWAFGAVCHRADPQFPTRYRAKALGKATAARRAAVRHGLDQLAESAA